MNWRRDTAGWIHSGAPHVGVVLSTVLLAAACSPDEGSRAGAAPAGPPAAATTPQPESPAWDDKDWDIFSQKVQWSVGQRLDTLGMGEAMARLGETFVGTAYVPGTLNPEGPERVVINFRGLDCVTFVENVYAMNRFVREVGAEALDDRERAQIQYEELLADVRYRDGELDGYESRLHYFSEWIADNSRRGLVEDVTSEFDPVADPEPINFMTTHTDAYPQLSDPDAVAAIRAAEERLNQAGRWYIPQEKLPALADRIRTGDIIAATSTVEGLDIAHTGIALWRDGKLHLMHAPLVGKDVQISEASLPDRLLRISGQDGIMVARPQDPRGAR